MDGASNPILSAIISFRDVKYGIAIELFITCYYSGMPKIVR
jgi:hypothetical protein